MTSERSLLPATRKACLVGHTRADQNVGARTAAATIVVIQQELLQLLDEHQVGCVRMSVIERDGRSRILAAFASIR